MAYVTDAWKVIEDVFEKDNMRLSESLMSLGNGYMGLRGNFEESYSGDTHRGTYLGGVWFPDKTRVGWWKNGYPQYFGKVINAVNLIGMRVYADDIEIDLNALPVIDFYRELDMQTGILKRTCTVKTPRGFLRMDSERFVSLKQKELLALRVTVTPSYDTKIKMVAFLDGDVRNLDANYDESFWELLDGDKNVVHMRTKENPFGTPRFRVMAAMSTYVKGLLRKGTSHKKGYVAQVFEGIVSANHSAYVDKFAVVVTDRDHSEEKMKDMALTLAETCAARGYNAHKASHIKAWASRWEMADVTVAGDEKAQQGIRFNLFHLLSTYSGEDVRLNIGPKGFTGEKYGGATYWDTEAYCLPVYMATLGEDVALQLLKYRFKQLDGAYENARQLGLRGALFPMVTFTGIECHNEWEITFEEIHRNGAIAYAIFNYTTYTGKDDYALNDGLDVLYGIALFFAYRAHYSDKNRCYMIHGVTGPNEYENNVNNNWYTNRMAAWCIGYFLDNYRKASAKKKMQLNVADSDLAHMRDVMNNMYEPYDESLGIYVQHDTFLDKHILPAADIPKAERPINHHWSWDRILRSCYIKQADVLQGMYFLEHLYDVDTILKHFNYYEPLTVHESSLSPCVHSILASRTGLYDKAVEMYRRTARLDLDNINNDTEDGLHITSMSGSWLAIVQGFAGMRTVDGLRFSPYLPDCFTGYTFKIVYRNRLIKLSADVKGVTVTLLRGDALALTLFSEKVTLETALTRPYLDQ